VVKGRTWFPYLLPN